MKNKNMKSRVIKNRIQRSAAFLLMLAFSTTWAYGLVPGLREFSPEIKTASAAGSPWKIRQEINIINGYMSAAASSYATSSAIVSLDKTKYSGTVTYYFEVVASTTAGISGDVYLRSTTGTTYATASYDSSATSPKLIRSSAFIPPSSATNLVVVIDNEAGATKSIKAARIIVLQDFADDANSAATSTQTQIEIGNQELGKTNTTNSALSSPKYWYYDADKWDGTLTAYAEVTYQNTQVASSTTWSSDGTYSHTLTNGVSYLTVEAWGAGGAGGLNTSIGGGGGGGGAYARSVFATTTGQGTIVVGNGQTFDSTNESPSSYNDTAGGTVATEVVAEGGDGSGTNTAGAAGADSTGGVTVGQLSYAGGAGGTGLTTNDTSGGGGGSGGPSGVGTGGQAGQTSTGGHGGLANGGNGLENNRGDSGAGSAGTSAATGGGGGGGGDTGTAGGNGGAPGGGGGGSEVSGCSSACAGADGQVKLTETHGKVSFALEEDDGNFGSWTFKKMITQLDVSTSTSERVRSDAFTPTNGRHYRIVASSTNSSATYNVYNAKIIVNSGHLFSSWGYRKSITIDNTKVSGSGDLTDFPILVNVTDANLASYAQSDGDDIFFTSSDGVTQLSHEIEKYESSNGELVAWVKIPTLDGDADTTIYMYYGNSGASNQEDPENVWDSNFIGVWHLAEDVTDEGTAASVYQDSTVNNKDGTQAGPVDISAKISVGQDFDGTNDHISIGDYDSMDNATQLTGCVWVKHDTLTSDNYIISNGGPNEGVIFFRDDVGSVSGRTDMYNIVVSDSGDTDTARIEGATGASSQDAWTYVCFTAALGSETGLRLYINAVEDANGPVSLASIGVIDSLSSDLILGGNNAGSQVQDGVIDEIRISDTVRSQDWIKTEYNNQNATSTFYTIGTAEATPSSSFTKLETQYLLANTTLSSGTSLQNFLTKWDSGEWTGSANTYLTAVDASDNNTSVVGVYTAADALVTDSTVSSPDNYATSTSGLTMPASTNLDVKATTNNNGIYSIRILVQAAQTDSTTLSGTVYSSEGGSNIGANKTITAYKNGTTLVGTDETDSNGAYSISDGIVDGDVVTVYIDGETEKGNTVYITDGVDTSNVDLYVGALIVRHDSGSSITNANLHTGAIYGETDMVFSTSTSDAITLNSNTELHVWTGDTYEPGGSVTTQGTGSIHVDDGATVTFGSGSLTIADDLNVDTGATVNINIDTSIADDIITAGTATVTTTEGTPTVTLTGSATLGGGSNALTFYNLTGSGSGTMTVNSTTTVNNNMTAGSKTWNFTTAYEPLSVGGTFTADTSTVSFQGAGATTIPLLDYYNLDLSPASGSYTYTPASSAVWSYRKSITIDADQVSGSSDLTAFPVLINLTDANLASNAQADGDDIKFVSADGSTQLAHEIEKYNNSTGELVAWVKVPTLDYDDDTVIYMYYGNSGATNQQNSTGVWDSNYKGVWHLPNGTTLSVADSTSNGYNGTNSGTTAATGKIDGGSNNAGTDTVRLDVSNPTNAMNLSAHTHSFWVNFDSLTNAGSDSENYIFDLGSRSVRVESDGQIVGQVTTNSSYRTSRSSGSVTTGGWNYIVATYSTSNNLVDLYLNGTEVSYEAQGAGGGSNGTDTGLRIGASLSNEYFGNPDATLDELRISNIERSADWIMTEYNNQSATSTFYAIGNQEDVEGTPLVASNNLTLGGAGNVTLNLSTNDTALDINGSLTIGSGDTLSASASAALSVAGNFTNNGTFTSNAGTVTFDSTGTSVITSAANMTFHNFTAVTPGKTLQFEAHGGDNVPTFTISGTMTVTGQAGSPIHIRSNTPTSQWLVSFSQPQSLITYVTVHDSACAVGSYSVAYSVTNSGGGNNGSCWNIANRGSDGTAQIGSVEQGSGGGNVQTGGGRGGGGGGSGSDGGSGGGEAQTGGGSGGGGGGSTP